MPPAPPSDTTASHATGAPATSSRWQSAQPNVSGRGIVASYTPQFWGLVVLTGIVAGLGAIALVALLRIVEHVAYGYRSGPYLDGVSAAAGWRHLAALSAAATITCLGVLVLGRLTTLAGGQGGTDVSDALWLRGGRLDLGPSCARAVISIVTVALGVSLGREGAPQVVGAVTGGRLAEWARLPIWQRRLLVACGAGAGFAAVYDVPLGGALFALEVLLGSVSLPLVLPALASAVIATTVAWTTLGDHPVYHLPSYQLRSQEMVWALLAGPVIGLVGVAWVRFVRRAGAARPTGRGRFVAPWAAFLTLALLSLAYPELLGNGKGIVQLGATGELSIGLLAILFVLKPIVTAACLGSGSPGGLFTPSLTIGVLLAGILGKAFDVIWPGAPLGAYAVIGGGAFLAAAMQGPLAGTVLVLELSRTTNALLPAVLLAVVEATVITRYLGAPSIYSARLRQQSPTRGEDAADIATIMKLDKPEAHGQP